MLDSNIQNAIAHLNRLLRPVQEGASSEFVLSPLSLIDLPLWIREAMTVYPLSAPSGKILIAVPHTELEFDGLVTAYELLSKKLQQPVILLVDKFPAKSRGVLVRLRIPYMTSQGQLFAPELGLVLKKNDSAKEPHSFSQKEKLFPLGQKVIAAYLLNHRVVKEWTKLIDLRKNFEREKIDLSLSTLSRVFQQLAELDFVKVAGLGPNKTLTFNHRDVVWSKLLAIDVETVTKKYKEYSLPDSTNQWVYSGDTALAHYSDLAEDKTPTIAMFYFEYKKWKEKIHPQNLSTDSAPSVKIEIWKGLPKLLADEGKYMNIVELSLSLRHNPDPRIKLCLQQALATVDLDSKLLWG